MKKVALTLLIGALSASAATAQVEIGLKVSPALTSLRADGSANQFAGSSKLSLGGGIVVDYFFGENYAFSTGLELMGKGGKVSYNDPATGKNEELKIGAQYLQVPLTVKLFTNDVATDTKLYFQLGGVLGGNIGTRINGEKEFTDPGQPTGTAPFKANKFLLIPDFGVMAGFGAEYQVGQSTKVFGGLRYQRGLPNVDNYFEDERDFKNVVIKNSEFALDFGLKF